MSELRLHNLSALLWKDSTCSQMLETDALNEQSNIFFYGE